MRESCGRGTKVEEALLRKHAFASTLLTRCERAEKRVAELEGLLTIDTVNEYRRGLSFPERETFLDWLRRRAGLGEPEPAKPDLKLPSEWERLDGVRVKDPDGWRNERIPWNRPISRETWDRLSAQSTMDLRQPEPAKPPPIGCDTCTGANDCKWPERAHGGPCSGYSSRKAKPPAPRVYECSACGHHYDQHPDYPPALLCANPRCRGRLIPGRFVPDKEDAT